MDYNTIQSGRDPNQAIYCVAGLYLFTCLYSVQSFGSSSQLESHHTLVGRTLLTVTPSTALQDSCRVYFANTGDCLFKVWLTVHPVCLFNFLFYFKILQEIL